MYLKFQRNVPIRDVFSNLKNRNQHGSQTGFNPSASLQEVIMEREDSDSEYDGEQEEVKEQRDDLRNPFWIEDKDPKIRNGPRGHLKMDEIEFWKGIAKESIG